MTLCDRLDDEFMTFCRSIAGAESVDSLRIAGPNADLKKADFFFENRRIICEVKSLHTETNDKLVKVLLEAGVSLQPGTFELTKALRGRLDENELYRKCVNVITTAVSDGVAEANRQIRDTKRLFGVDRADGLLVFLHGRVHVLNPDVIVRRIGQRLAKRGSDGISPAYPQLTQIVLFSEIHKLKVADGTLMSAMIPLKTEVAEEFGVSEFTRRMIEGWGAWNGRVTHTISADALR